MAKKLAKKSVIELTIKLRQKRLGELAKEIKAYISEYAELKYEAFPTHLMSEIGAFLKVLSETDKPELMTLPTEHIIDAEIGAINQLYPLLVHLKLGPEDVKRIKMLCDILITLSEKAFDEL